MQVENEKAISDDLASKLRHIKNDLDSTDREVRQLTMKLRDVNFDINLEQEEAVKLRSQRENLEEQRRQLESEVNALGNVCEMRGKANEHLGRELEQMAEDDEIIR
jgi:chromosome segregation ATPase